MRTPTQTISLGAISSLLPKVVTVIAGVITVPLLLRAVGDDVYGLYIALTALVGFVSLTDFGLTTAVRNKISYLHARKAFQEINRLVSGALFFFSIIILPIFLLSLSLLLADAAPLQFLLSIRPQLLDIAVILFILILLMTLFNISISNIVRSLYYGLQKIHVYNLFQAVYNVLFVTAFIFFLLSKPDIISIALFHLAGTLIRFIILLGLAKYRFSWFRITLQPNSVRSIFPLIKSSLLFFWLALAASLIVRTDTIIVSHYLGTVSVAVFAITHKLFQLPSEMVSLAEVSSPTIAYHYEKKDLSTLTTVYRQVLRLNLILRLTVAGFLLLYAKPLIAAWVGPELFAGQGVIIAFFLMYMMYAWIGPHMSFINAMSIHKSLALPFLVNVVLNLIVSIILVQYIGLLGIVIGTLAGGVVTTSIIGPLVLKRHLKIKPLKELTRVIVTSLVPFAVLVVIYLSTQNLSALLSVKLLLAATTFAIFAFSMFRFTLVNEERRYLVNLMSKLVVKPHHLN